MVALFGWIATARPAPANLLNCLGARSADARLHAGAQSADGMSALGVSAASDRHARASGFGSDAAGRLVAYVGRPAFRAGRWRTRAETAGIPAALLEAYGLVGPDLPEQLTGTFALAVIDPAAERALLATDRMGVQQLAYASVAGGLAFASDLDVLASHPAVGADITPQAIYRYAVNAVSPAPETIYSGVTKLLPAHQLHWRSRSSVRPRPYWTPPKAAGAAGQPQKLEAQLRARLDAAVAGVLAPDPGRPTGAFLSGGLDSSVVAGLLGRQLNKDVPAFTIAFDDPRFDESDYAALAAAHFGLQHHVRRMVPDDAADLVPTLAAACDEPFGNSSLLPAYVCARMARAAGVELLLAGDGGDELFAGNKRYVEQQILALYGRVPGPLRAGLNAALSALPARFAVSWLGKAQRYVVRASQPMPGRMLANPVYHSATLARIFTADALAAIDPGAPEAAWARHFQEAGTDDLVHAMQRVDWRVTLADNDLRKVQRAGQLAGVEIAYPMLDDELVAFAAALPSDLLIQRFRLRAFFKDAMAGFLPEAILSKPKHGFGMPFSEWTRADPGMRALVGDAFAGLKQRHIFRADFLDDVLLAHAEDSDPDLSAIVWDLMMLEIWWQAHDTLAEARENPVDPTAPAFGAKSLPEALP